MKKLPLLALFMFAVLYLGASAQEKTTPIAAAAVASSCNSEAAVEIIQQQLAETKTYDDGARRITVLIRGADLLWPSQEETARAAFVEAFQLAIQHYKEKGDEPKVEGIGMAITVPDMRYVVINAIARRDSAWARKLINKLVNDEVNEAKEKSIKDSYQQSRSAEKLLSIAGSLLASDQATALSFAGQSLRFPATMHLPMFLYRLAEVNRTASDQFYRSAVAAYAKSPMERFLYLSAYPFGNDREAGETPGYAIYNVPAGFTPNTDLQRLLVQTLLSRVREQIARPASPLPGNRLTETEQMWLALNRLEKQIAQTIPDLGPAVEQARGSLSAQLPENSEKRLNENMGEPEAPPGSFAEQLEAAEKNPDVNRRDQFLVSAIIAASEKEDLDFVLRAVDKISESGTRTQLLNWLYFSRTWSAIKQGDLALGRRLAAKVEELDQRGFLYFRIADESLKPGVDQTQAREVLEEVVTAAEKAPMTMMRARTQLGVANLYTKIDHSRAIAVLGEAVKTINGLESPDFTRQFVIRRIEGRTFGSYAAFQTPGFNPENAFREIAKVDFDGTLYQANNFSSKSLRALTTLAVVEPCLKISKQPVKTRQKPAPAKP